MILKKFISFMKELIDEWNKDRVTLLAAALAYYAVFSIGPMLLIIIWVSGLAFGEAAVEGRVVGEISGLVGQQGAELIQSMIKSARQTTDDTLASILGFVTLIISSAALIRQLQTSINLIWNVEAPEHRGGVVWSLLRTIQTRFFSFGMVLGIGFLLMVALVISAAIGVLNEQLESILPQTFGIIFIVNQTVSLVIFTTLFALMFKILPDAQVEWPDVLVGAFFSAVLFNVGKYVLGMYLGNSGFGSTYGAAGALVLLLAWIYYSSQILLLGAEFTQVFARNYGSKIISADELEAPDVEPGFEEERKVAPARFTPPIKQKVYAMADQQPSPSHYVNPVLRRKRSHAQKLFAGLLAFVGAISAFIFARET